MSIHDFGGQRDFDVIHSFFIDANGVYVLVFNMEWMVSELKTKCLDYLSSWMSALIVHSSVIDNSLRGHKLNCASIAIVGTYKDKVSDFQDHRYISRTLDELLGKSVAWRSVIVNRMEGLCFFPIDCTQGQADTSLVNLMTALENDIQNSHYVNVERPLNYFKVLDDMNVKKKTVSYLTLGEVFAIADSNFVSSLELKIQMLRFFRELGFIMWHEDPALQSIVILDPIEFFVNPATSIVCQHVKDNQGTVHMNDVLDKARKFHRNDFERIESRGVISLILLKFIIEEHLKAKDSFEELYNNRYAAIHDLMVKYSLLVLMNSGALRLSRTSGRLPYWTCLDLARRLGRIGTLANA